MANQIKAEEWMQVRVAGEVERMLIDFNDRNLSFDDESDFEEMADEITELVLKKRWKRA